MSSNKRHNCPFCPALGKRNDDLALSVNWGKEVYHCFRCGTSGRVDSLPPNFKQPLILREDRKTKEPLDFGSMTSLADSVRGQNYIKGRGLNPQLLENFVFVSRNKLVFPIYNPQGNIIYYVSRKMWGPGLRYDNKPSEMKDIYIPPGSILPTRLTFCVTEGVLDCLSVYQWLGIECIALLGMGINNFKVRRILEYTYPETRIIILLDAGEYQTAQAYYDEIRTLRFHTKICKLSEGDPNSLGKEKLKKEISLMIE